MRQKKSESDSDAVVVVVVVVAFHLNLQVPEGGKITMNFPVDTGPKIRDTKFQPIIFPTIFIIIF